MAGWREVLAKVDEATINSLRILASSGRLLFIWGAMPWPPAERVSSRLPVVRRWLSEVYRLPPIAWPLAMLPSGPVLSLDPTPRLHEIFSDARPIWMLGGDLGRQAGLLVTWDDVKHLNARPDKSEMLRQARTVCRDGGILILNPYSNTAFGRIWKMVLEPVLVGQGGNVRVWAVGPGPWPDGIIPLASDLRSVLDIWRAEDGSAEETGYHDMKEVYTDFELHITPQGHAIARSDEGESPPVQIPTAIPNSLHLALELIEQRQTSASLLEDFGKALYNHIFPSPIHTHFQQTEAAARARGTKIRLRLRIEHPSLARLPLEFLYRSLSGYYFAVHPGTVLSRYLNVPLPLQRGNAEFPLHLLLIVANPKDQGRLDPDEWEEIVREALREPLTRGLLTMDVVKRATRRRIRDVLLRRKPDIVQFVGHGIYRQNKGYLALVDEDTDQTWVLDDQRFANLFLGFDEHLKVVSLATCESAKSDSPQGFLGIAPRIVQRGVPAVIAMQYSVLVKTAKLFMEDFYVALAASKPIDWAVQTARNAISQEMGLDNREFATPVLYMRAPDGEIL